MIVAISSARESSVLVAGEANTSLVIVIIILTAVTFNFSDEQYLAIFREVGGMLH